jgi:hypothetical protein
MRYWNGGAWTQHRYQSSNGFAPPDPGGSSAHRRQRPSPRLIRSPEDAELAAAEWMRFYGYADATRTPAGADGGLDVVATGAVAQVKDYGTSIGRPVLQQLQGAALGRDSLFFSRQGYTREAVAWAEQVGMALFRFDLQGEPEPINPLAIRIAAGRPACAVQPIRLQQIGWFVPTQTAERAAVAEVGSARVGRFSQRDRVEGIWQSWLPVHLIRYDITEPVGRRQILRQTTLNVALESVTGRIFAPPKRPDPPVQDYVVHSLMTALSAEMLVARISEDIARLSQLRQPAARSRMQSSLAARGLPAARIHSAQVSVAGTLLHPVYLGVLASPWGRRTVALDGVSGLMLTSLSEALTSGLTHLDSQLGAMTRIS